MNPWIDVTVPIRPGMPVWPGDAPFQRRLVEAIANGDACNLSHVSCSTHTGTHIDAPRHFIEGAPTIDAMPLHATVGRARVIEIKDPHVISRSEVAAHHPAKGERLLFKTLNSASLWKLDHFSEDFVYIPPDTAEYLAEAGIRMVGVDYLSVGGFHAGGPETHRALLGAGIWIIEGLNLEQVGPGDYELVCLPLKLEGSDGAMARAIVRML